MLVECVEHFDDPRVRVLRREELESLQLGQTGARFGRQVRLLAIASRRSGSRASSRRSSTGHLVADSYGSNSTIERVFDTKTWTL